MDTQEKQTQPGSQNNGKTPDYRLSLVRETQYGDQWLNIGVGWRHKDGEGISFTGDLLKMFGFKLIVQKFEPRP